MSSLMRVYIPSEDVVAREIEGQFIIVPLAAGIGDMEDELYSLNESGLAIWKQLDGKNSLRQISSNLAQEYEGPISEIEQDVRWAGIRIAKKENGD